MNTPTKRIWELTRGQGCRYGLAVVALVLSSCCLYLVPLVPYIVLDGVLASAPETASPSMRRVIELAGGREFLRHNVWLAALAVVALSGLAGLFTYLRGRCSALASQEVARQARERLYDQFQHLPQSFYDHSETGDLVQRATSDVETLREFFATQVVQISRAALMIVVVSFPRRLQSFQDLCNGGTGRLICASVILVSYKWLQVFLIGLTDCRI